MKIIFFISSIKKKNDGIGGHYYSLLETVKVLSKKNEVQIINIGLKKAKSLEDSVVPVSYVISENLNLLQIYNQTKSILKQIKPDFLQAFDIESYLWARLFGKKLKIRNGITKCGGVNTLYFPAAKNIVLFSKENELFFEKKRKFRNSNIYLIPNRTTKFEQDEIRINKLKKLINYRDDCIYILRIVRIGSYYHDSTKEIIYFVNKLNDKKLKCSLILIGSVEDVTYLKELKNISNKNCYFVNDEDYTKNSKELIALADIVFGTGRSLMEAASMNKVLLIPSKNLKDPVLLDKETFEEGFYYNFSERTVITNVNQEENFKKIKNIIVNKNLREKYKEFSFFIFNKYFNTESLSDKYNYYFENMKSKNPLTFDFLLHFLFVIRKYILK